MAALDATLPKSVAHRLLVASLVKASNEAWELKQKEAVKAKTVPMSPVVQDFDNESRKLFKNHFLIDEKISKEELKTDKRILAALKEQSKHLRDLSGYLNPTAQRKNTQLLYDRLKSIVENIKASANNNDGVLGGLLVGNGGVDTSSNRNRKGNKTTVSEAKKKPGFFSRSGGKLGKLFGVAAAGLGIGSLFGISKDVDGAAPATSPDTPLIDNNNKTPTTVEQKTKDTAGKTKSLPQETMKDVPDAKKVSAPNADVLDDDIKVKGKGGGWASKLTGSMGRMLGVAATVATAVPDVIDTAKVVNDESATTEEKSRKVGATTGKVAGGVGGAVVGGNVGAWVGGGIGALFGGVGAVPGAFIGGVLGSAIGGWLGSEGGEVIGDAVGGAVAEAIPNKKPQEAVAVTKEAPNSPTQPPVTTVPPGVVKDKDVGGTVKEVKVVETQSVQTVTEPLTPYEPPSLGRVNEFKPYIPPMMSLPPAPSSNPAPAINKEQAPSITVPKLSGEGKAVVSVTSPPAPEPVVNVQTLPEPETTVTVEAPSSNPEPVVNVQTPPAPETTVTVEAPTPSPTLREKAKAVTSNAVTAYKESDNVGQGVVNAAKSVPKTLKALKENPRGLSELDQKAASKATYLESLATRESGPNYQSSKGKYVGAFQMSPIALQTLGYMDEEGNWTGKDNVFTTEDFLNNKKVQDKAAMSLAKTNWNILNKEPIGEQDGMPVFAKDLVGKEIQGVKVTESGLLGAAHLGGASSVSRMLKSGGKEMPVDGNDVPIINYLQTMGGKDVSRITGNKDVTDQIGAYSPAPDTKYYLAGTNREVKYADPKPADRIAGLTYPKVAAVSPNEEKERMALAQTKVAVPSNQEAQVQSSATSITSTTEEKEAATTQPAPEFPRAHAIEQPSSADFSRLENIIKETTVIKEGGTSVVAVNGGNGRDVSINFNNTPVMVNDLGLIVINNGIL